MQKAALYFLGEHDFRSFCKADVKHVTSFRRNILDFRIQPEPGIVIDGFQLMSLHVRGTAFLWHQVLSEEGCLCRPTLPLKLFSLICAVGSSLESLPEASCAHCCLSGVITLLRHYACPLPPAPAYLWHDQTFLSHARRDIFAHNPSKYSTFQFLKLGYVSNGRLLMRA